MKSYDLNVYKKDFLEIYWAYEDVKQPLLHHCSPTMTLADLSIPHAYQ